MGHLLPSFLNQYVWFARPTTTPSRKARVAGLSTGCAGGLVNDLEHTFKRLAQPRPAATNLLSPRQLC
jgi:hypothetical protein